ncbi:TonB-dependent receptor [soil metagenome]
MTYSRQAAVQAVFSRRLVRQSMLATAGVFALCLGAQAARAQQAVSAPVGAAAPEDQADPLLPNSDVVVTGSRISRSGYDTPTPVTVIGEAELAAAAPANIADFVNELPSVSGSSTRQTGNAAISNGAAGINSLNLRALGNARTLVLLDGRRTVGSTVNGTVDINTFPQGLVKNVEIVTGGASAAYGSDAVSGVVNFILDKKYTGIKGSIEGGETTYGDDQRWRINVSAGTGFAGGRGHILLNGEVVRGDGIYGVPRDWNNGGDYIVQNPAYAAGNGQPDYLVTKNAGPQLMTPGGLITGTSSTAATAALRGTYFGVNGTVNRLAYGVSRSASDPDMIGGDWNLTRVNDTQSLLANEHREGGFGRVSYDLFDGVSVFGEASYNRDASVGWGGAQRNEGGVTIRIDNAFLPASVRQTAIANGVNPTTGTITIGTSNGDLDASVGNRVTDNWRTVQRYVFGLEGDFGALGMDWKWDASAQRGITNTHEEVGTTNNARLALAQDAVVAAAGNTAGVPTGTIICRSTLTSPTNGCVPFNRLGVGVNSAAAIAYVMGFPYREQRFVQDVGAINFSTNIGNPWFAPIGIAFGIEHRVEKVSGYVPVDYQAGWFTGNYLPTFGEYNVTEGYFEALLSPFKGLDVNGAVRVTNYSTSGRATTWKIGATFEPIPDIKFRVTRSRDIRAPNLAELFQAGQRRTNTVIDPFAGNIPVQFLENTTGNPTLTPEIADTLGFGVVLRPSFLEGFGFSVDYYKIDIKDAIGTVTVDQIVNSCFAGNQTFCAALTRQANSNGVVVITDVANRPFNFAKVSAKGLDFEASYRLPLTNVIADWSGVLSLRAMATHYISLISDNGIDPPTDTAGQNSGTGTPDWLYRVTAGYTGDRLTLQLTGRGISAGTYDNSYIECASSCPASSSLARTISNNRLPGAFYLDSYVAYKLLAGKQQAELFFNVSNLTNKDPAIVAQGPSGPAHINPLTNSGLYDSLGRVFRVGVRFALK